MTELQVGTLRAAVFQTVYVMGASCDLMDKVRRTCNAWAEGDETICLTREYADEIEELEPLLRELDSGGDVILSL